MEFITANKKQKFATGNYLKFFLCNILVFSTWCTSVFATTPQEQFRDLLVQLRENKNDEESKERKLIVEEITTLINQKGDYTFLTIHKESDVFAYLIQPDSSLMMKGQLYVNEIYNISNALIKKINNKEQTKAAINYEASMLEGKSSPLAYVFQRMFSDPNPSKFSSPTTAAEEQRCRTQLGSGDTTLISFLINNGLDVKKNVSDGPFIEQVIENDKNSIDGAFRVELLKLIKGADANYFDQKSWEMLIRTMMDYNSDKPRASIHEEVLKYLLDHIIASKNPKELINKVDGGGQTLLHKAVRCRNKHAIVTLLNNGANPNIQDTNHGTPNSTPLHLLCANPEAGIKEMTPKDYNDVLKVFDEKGADRNIKNSSGKTCKELLAKSTNEGNFVKKLQELVADKNAADSIERNSIINKIVELINESGDESFLNIQDKQDRDAFAYLMSPDQSLYIDEIIKISEALVKKIKKKDPNSTAVRTAIKYPLSTSDASKKGPSPLVHAFNRAFKSPKDDVKSGWGNSSLIKFLIDNGINGDENIFGKSFILHVVNGAYAVNDDFRIKVLNLIKEADEKSFFTTMWEGLFTEVISSNKVSQKVIEYIITLNPAFKINEVSFGTTPLHTAVSNGNENAILALLNQGADPNIKDKEGNTPLHLLGSSSDKALTPDTYERVLEKFKNKKANFTIKNNAGATCQALIDARSAAIAAAAKSNSQSAGHWKALGLAALAVSIIGTGVYFFNKHNKKAQNQANTVQAKHNELVNAFQEVEVK